MRELDAIRNALAAAVARNESVMLATVIEVEGSVYRGRGARMLVTQSGESIGAVSGGCLEADIVARAPEVIERNTAEIVQYDTRASDDVVLGLGLGCQGVIDLLLEPFSGGALSAALELYSTLAETRAPVRLEILVEATAELPVGTWVLRDESGAAIMGSAHFPESGARIRSERIKPSLGLVICGAGSDAIPVARLAKAMGWSVTMVDHRPLFLEPARYPDADELVCVNAANSTEEFRNRVGLSSDTVAVIMAHSAAHDRAYLHEMVAANAAYIGVLGPKRRTLELLGELPLTPNIHSPIGLDIGAESPDEIALAIVAEIAASTAGRPGSFLRDRPGSIHSGKR